jgi:hypothetical protein
MNNTNPDDGSKKVKNIAAIVYLLVLIFLIGGSYINQQTNKTDANQQTNEPAP